ncbi:MAG: MFS transporter [Solirubrobacteraceae bacterium]
MILLLAVACGAAVANLYYVQPLLNLVVRAFGVSDSTAGRLVTVSQVGYVIGLVVLVPLGDLLERRRLITRVLLGAAAAAAACAAAPSFIVLAAALAALGALSVVAMIMVPLAATLAGPEHQGRVVGTVMSGVLVGILASRTLSGLIAALGGGPADMDAPAFPTRTGSRRDKDNVRTRVVAPVLLRANELRAERGEPPIRVHVTPRTFRRTYITFLIAAGHDLP